MKLSAAGVGTGRSLVGRLARWPLRMGPLAIGAALRSWPRAPMLMLPGRARSDEFRGRPVSDLQDGRRKYCRPGPCCCAARSPTAAQGYGTGPAAIMLIDRAVSAYQEFVRITGWIANLSIHIEREFFGSEAPRADVQGRTIPGLTVEQHLAHLRGSMHSSVMQWKSVHQYCHPPNGRRRRSGRKRRRWRGCPGADLTGRLNA